MMARRIPENRFDELVDAATEVFIARGYRLTQMSDIAEAVGVAKGTLYGYVESKDALFLLCLVHADREGPLEHPAELPVRKPRSGELGALIKQRVSGQSIPLELSAALARERAEDPRAELEAVVREFYQTFERFCRGIKLIDRCSDHPELGGIWQTEGREAPRAALVRYLEMRMQAGQLRRVANVRLAARMIIEVVTTWAIHIKWDRSPEEFDPAEARENAIDFLVSALAIVPRAVSAR
jgi:AcrR family transcriptional regulator